MASFIECNKERYCAIFFNIVSFFFWVAFLCHVVAVVCLIDLLFHRWTVAITWKVEDLVPPTERCIFNFNSKEELKRWHLYADSEYGGMEVLNFLSPLRRVCMKNYAGLELLCAREEHCVWMQPLPAIIPIRYILHATLF